MNHRPPMNHPVDLDALENDIGELLHTSQAPRGPYAPHESNVEPLPPRVMPAAQHREISKLSADVVLEQYKLAAKAIEAMGEEVQRRATALEAASAECVADMKLLKEAAEMVVEKGKQAHAEIERTTAVSRDIREVIESVKAKLA